MLNICNLFYRLATHTKLDERSGNIIGYENERHLFHMPLISDERVSILLTGPPASAKRWQNPLRLAEYI
jgi:hypothetical protein